MSLTASVLHRQGQKLYMKGDFEAAIDVFSQALERPAADIIGILDNRAATYGRLQNFRQATRDARRMIRDSKEDERGYMRCAKLLLQEGKMDKALQIYRYGLENLPSNHPRRSKLEELRDKLQSNMEQFDERIMLHHRDPFTTLPMEIIFFILQDLSFKQIVAIMRVSKSWNRLLASIRSLWMKIDMTGARSFVRSNSIGSYIGRSRGQLTHATIRNVTTESVPKVLEFLSRCRRLEHLDLNMWVGGIDLYGMLSNSRQQLKSLVVSSDILFMYSFIPRLLALLPGLERLEVWNIKHATGGRPEDDFEWPALLPNLKSITLGSTSTSSEGYDGTIHAVHVPNLHWDIHRLPYPNLQELRLDWNPPYYRPFSFPAIHPFPRPTDVWRLPPLRRLQLRGATLRTDFWQILPTSIEYLHIRGSRFFSGWADSPEVKFPHLHTLILDDCSWCREQFLTSFLVTARAPIQTLHISGCSGLLARELSYILSRANQMDCPAVKSMSELALTQCRDMDDEVTPSIVTMLPALKVLDLSATSITGVTIRLLADQRKSESTEMAKLDCLVVRGCGEVSRDAVAYGREKGLRVVFQL